MRRSFVCSMYIAFCLVLPSVTSTKATAGTDGVSPGYFKQTLKSAAADCQKSLFEIGKSNFPGITEGPWTVLDDGKKFITGECRSGKAEGTWMIYHDHGAEAVEAPFHEGKAEGLWRFLHYNGKLIIEEEYRHGVENGRYTEWDKVTGDKMMSGTLKEGLRDGSWHHWSHGKEQVDIWKDGQAVLPKRPF